MSTPSKFSLFKRSNGIYYILFVQDGKTVWKSTGVTLKSDALKALTQFRELLKDKQDIVTLTQFRDEFIPFAEGNYSKATVEFYRNSLNHLISMTGDVSLPSLTMQHLDQYKVKRLNDCKGKSDEKVSAVTVNRELQALRAAMNTAGSWKKLESNPFSNMQQVKIPEKQPHYFSRADFQKLISTIKENWLKEVIIFAVLTGMRRGEILNLRWQDVDLRRKLITIQSNPTFKTKQGKRRVIPMSEVVYNMLNGKRVYNIAEYIFHINGTKIYDDHASKKLKNYVSDIGLNGKLHFHSLRHTFASWLVQDGVSLYEVQKLLGHSNISVTQVYSHLQPETLHNTVNKISLQLN
jgi:integrase